MRPTTVPVLLAAVLSLAPLVAAAQASAPEPVRPATTPVAAVAPARAAAPSFRFSRVDTVTVLGDSVALRRGCGCRPFPGLFGTQLRHAGAGAVLMHNDAISGRHSADLLWQVRNRSWTQSDIAGSQVVAIIVGANDFSYNYYRRGGCGSSAMAACYHHQLVTLERNVRATVARIHALRHHRATAVLVIGYWNLWLDGKVGERLGSTYVRDSTALTQAANSELRAAARGSGATYVDLVPVFHGPHVDTDALLAADGNHPDEAGQRAIARAMRRAL